MGCGADHEEKKTECTCATCCDEPCGPRPNPIIMALRFAAFGTGIIMALVGMIKERKFKLLGAWLGVWSVFLTIARYIICSRCEGYGQMCYSYYIGKYTSLVLPGVEGKDVGPVGIGLEAACLGSIFWIPAVAMRGDRRMLARYLAVMQLVLIGQVFHACRWCARNSTQEWKNQCPVHRTWKKALKIS
ncbi:MAG: hypothetical protein PHP28_03725 [Actinomycetota bacterium]|nr:hypothetical protein [Actinomycetota bacterium]MDD5666461.1 hypothetical protein [Actinomycetota bacterium]